MEKVQTCYIDGIRCKFRQCTCFGAAINDEFVGGIFGRRDNHRFDSKLVKFTDDGIKVLFRLHRVTCQQSMKSKILISAEYFEVEKVRM